MKPKPGSIHLVGDCVIGLLLIAGPIVFGFSDNVAATIVTIVFGAAIAANSLFTMNPRRERRRLPMTIHMLIDGTLGGLLIAAPWMFGFAERTWIPHLVIGCVIAGRAVAYFPAARLLERIPMTARHAARR
jgi:hypothetical protein